MSGPTQSSHQEIRKQRPNNNKLPRRQRVLTPRGICTTSNTTHMRSRPTRQRDREVNTSNKRTNKMHGTIHAIHATTEDNDETHCTGRDILAERFSFQERYIQNNEPSQHHTGNTKPRLQTIKTKDRSIRPTIYGNHQHQQSKDHQSNCPAQIE